MVKVIVYKSRVKLLKKFEILACSRPDRAHEFLVLFVTILSIS